MSLFSKKSLDFELVTTKTGDDGKSSLFSGERKFKNDIRFDLMGNIDELTSWLGVVRNELSSVSKNIHQIQNALYKAMSVLATNPNSELYENIDPLTEKDVVSLERYQKDIYDKTSIPQRFIIPGELNGLSAKLDFARSIARRCERSVVEYIQETSASSYSNFHDIKVIQQYLNRLSDYLFVLARFAETEKGKKSIL